MKIKKFNELFMENMITEKKVSFNTNKSWNLPNFMTKRKSFNVDKVEDDIVYLSSDDETIKITKDGKIKSHYRNGHKMLQTYVVDNKTLSQLKRLENELWNKMKDYNL